MSDVVSSCRRVGWSGRELLCAGQRSAPLRAAGPSFWVGLGGGGGQAFGMSIDNELPKHYALLLGMGRPWEVKTVERKLQEKKVEIELGWPWGTAAKGPECGCEWLDPRPCAGTNVAALGHDTIHDLDSGAHPAGGVSGTRGQDEAGALGGALGTVHAAF